MNRASAFSTRSKHTNDIEISNFMYLDTSFILELIDSQSNYVRDCNDFIVQADKNHDVFFTISGQVEAELRHTLIRKVYEGEANKLNVSWQVLYDEDPNYMELVDNETRKTLELLRNIGVIYLDYNSNQKFRDLTSAISTIGGLDTYDAEHVSIMLSNQHNSIVTLDHHFLKVPYINVYGPTRSIVKQSTEKKEIVEYEDGIIDKIMDEYCEKLKLRENSLKKEA